DPVASLNSVLPAVKAQPNRPVPELTNLTLMAARMNAPAAPAIASDTVDPDLAWAVDTSIKSWRVFKPAGENFSAEMPAGGKQVTISVPFQDQMFDFNVYVVRDGFAIYSAMWITAPSDGESDKAALMVTVRGLLKGMVEGYKNEGGGPFSCELESERNVSINGYTGSEFDLPACTVPGKVRVFTKVVGDQRQMYCGAVFYWQDDPNVSRFLKSFTAGPTARAKRPATISER
ncbi:MAG TPA: hypothetical protein VFO72_07370, partial [Pyrinomonadaceae bacterium]|nr:hypothetical protein [Pyrinomonadaceae bacterium]